MLTYRVEYWKLDKAVDRVSQWGATAVAYYREEGETPITPHIYVVTRRNRAWYTAMSERMTLEQTNALRAKAVCEFVYGNSNTAGTMHLLIIPKDKSEAAKQKLVNLIEKEMTHDKKRVHHKG